MKRILAIVAFLLLFGTIGHASLIVPNEPQPGQRYRLSASGIDPDFPFEATGLSAREAEHCWSDGKKVTFTIPFAKNVRAFVFENVTALGAQTVGVYVNDGFLKGYMFNNDTPVQNMVVVLRKDLRSPAVVEFRIPQACRPSKFFPDNTDPRELGLTFRTVALSGQLLKDKQQYTETDCQHWISRLEFMSKDITSIFGAGDSLRRFLE